MEIIKRHDVFDKFHPTEDDKKKFRRAKIENIDTIIIHGTGGGDSSKALIDGWIMSNHFERAAAYTAGEGFPFNIDVNGDVYELCDPYEYWQYHSGTWSPKMPVQEDMYTIGIELMNPHPENQSGYSVGQYAALLDLIFMIFGKTQIKKIYGHGAFQKIKTGKYKNCPGIRFKWQVLTNELMAKSYTYVAGMERITEINRV